MTDPGIPANWATANVQELFNIVGGGTPSTGVHEYWIGNTPWITSADIDKDHHINPRKCISEEAIQNSATNKVSAGSIIVVTRVGLGKVGIAPTDLCFSQDSQALLLNPAHFNPQYVLFFMGQAVAVFKHISRGTTISGVTKKQLATLKFLLPPTNEQSRIVAEIEKQFTRLDAAVAGLNRVQANLKRYRAAVLKEACEGRLVPTEAELARKEGRSYETGGQLLACILKERRAKWEAVQLAKMHASVKPPKNDDWKKKYKEPTTPHTGALPKLPDGWIWVNLDQIICSGPQNGLYKAATAYGSGAPILRIDDYQVNFCKPREELKCLRTSVDEEALYALAPGDIVLNRVNSPTHLGKCTVVTSALCPCVFESNLMRFRVSNLIDPEWVTNVLQTTDGKARLTANAKWAVNQASINQQDVTQTAVPLPPIAEQARILAVIRQQLSINSKLRREFDTTSRRTDRLRHSILKRAFEGKLVPQDPSDEPASALLDRIRSERNEPHRSWVSPKGRRIKAAAGELQ